MPYQILWGNNGVYRKYFGTVTPDQRRESLERICADHRFDELLYAVTDFRAVVELEVSGQSSLELAALNIGPLMTNPQIVLAAIAVDPAHKAYVQAVKSAGLIKRPYEIFETPEAATAWIALQTGQRLAAIAIPPRGDA